MNESSNEGEEEEEEKTTKSQHCCTYDFYISFTNVLNEQTTRIELNRVDSTRIDSNRNEKDGEDIFINILYQHT